jgi:hypothetical protein
MANQRSRRMRAIEIFTVSIGRPRLRYLLTRGATHGTTRARRRGSHVQQASNQLVLGICSLLQARPRAMEAAAGKLSRGMGIKMATGTMPADTTVTCLRP